MGRFRDLGVKIDNWLVDVETDKNGREIYEGDICSFKMQMEKLNGTRFVRWVDDGAYWGAKTKLPFLLHQADEIEVIGNIYENPELLGEG